MSGEDSISTRGLGIDVLVITALKDELDALRKCTDEHPGNWEEHQDSERYTYLTRVFRHNSGTPFTVAAASPYQMGQLETSALAGRLVHELKPRCLAMTGICAGDKGSVFLGDVIVADRVFDINRGKLIAHYEASASGPVVHTEDIFHDARTYNLPDLWRHQAHEIPDSWRDGIQLERPKSLDYQERWILRNLYKLEQSNDHSVTPDNLPSRQEECPQYSRVIERLLERKLLKWRGTRVHLTTRGRTQAGRELATHPDQIFPLDPLQPTVHVGPIGTTDMVTQDPGLFPRVKRLVRTVLGIEMESIAIGHVATARRWPIPLLVVKAVSDYGDKFKDDQFRHYACETSARFLIAFLKHGPAIPSLPAAPPADHYVRSIPLPPGPYVAHPYTLMQTDELIGRRSPLKHLTNWATASGTQLYTARVLSAVGIGGLGKSALAWKWFHDIAPHIMPHLAGRMWWSFYESDASFENLISRAFAYTSGWPKERVEALPLSEREEQLLSHLNERPFLLVLDGLERTLLAYARLDAAHMADDDLDQQTTNVVVGAMGLPTRARQSLTSRHRLRKSADPRFGAFLRKLTGVRATRILVSTRLYPADLQTDAGCPVPGSQALYLSGLTDRDALKMWQSLGVRGSREALLPLFHRLDNHPLALQALAGEVAYDRRSPRDFDHWKLNHPEFDPFGLPLEQVKSHILEVALNGLGETARGVLEMVAAFRMPVRYDALAALLIGVDKRCSDDAGLDQALNELEDRGLIGWDRGANQYDLHPVVRGVTRWLMHSDEKRRIYEMLFKYLDSLPQVEAVNVNSIDDLTTAIESYNSLLELERYDDAFGMFRAQLNETTLHRLSASRLRIELLEPLFPSGQNELPQLSAEHDQAHALSSLAHGYRFSACPGQAVRLFRRHLDIIDRISEHPERGIVSSTDIENRLRSQPPSAAARNWRNGTIQNNAGIMHASCTSLNNLADVLRLVGALRESEGIAWRAVGTSTERRLQILWMQSDALFGPADYPQDDINSLFCLGLVLMVRGETDRARQCFRRALKMGANRDNINTAIYARQAQLAIWMGDFGEAQYLAERAWISAEQAREERHLICAARLQGTVALSLGDWPMAEDRLRFALSRAQEAAFAEEELASLIGLGELHRRQSDLDTSRELLDDVWDIAYLGPYPLLHADAQNTLAQIERDAGDDEASIAAASEAYRLAWCDGPPFAYHWGLETAQTNLAELGMPAPADLRPYDDSRYEPMVTVPIE